MNNLLAIHRLFSDVVVEDAQSESPPIVDRPIATAMVRRTVETAEGNEVFDASPTSVFTTAVSTPPQSTWSELSAAILRPWLAWTVGIWGLGVVLCSLRPLLGWFTLRRLQRIGVAPASHEVMTSLHRLSKRLGLSRSVRVLQSPVAFAPDGKTVAAAGDSIRLYDVTTGEERLRIDRKQASHLQFTDEGKTLTGAVMGAIYRWDAATGKSLTPEAGDSIVEQILVTPDGSRVVTRGQGGDVHVWDGTDGKHLRRLADTVWQQDLAMSPDGRFLVWRIEEESIQIPDPDRNLIHCGSRIRLYDIAADKLVDRFPSFNGAAENLTFTDGGGKLVTVDHRDGMVRIWNVEAGQEERSFCIITPTSPAAGLYWRRPPGNGSRHCPRSRISERLRFRETAAFWRPPFPEA